MSESFSACEIELEFGDGQYLFRLPLPQIARLQEVCGAGLGAIVGRVMRGRYTLQGEHIGLKEEADWHVKDLVETIRQGLLGGGRGIVDGAEVKVGPVEANRLIEAYVLTRPLGEAWTLAAVILGVCIDGYQAPDEEGAKAKAPSKKAKAPKTGASTTPAH